MNIDKPDTLGKYDLVAILGFREAPIKAQDPMNMTYTKSTIAVNPFNNTILVYVTSSTKKGLTEFKTDYPNALITDEPLDEEKWRVTAFPIELGETQTPLDIYFKGMHKEKYNEIERNKIKTEVKRQK